MLQQLVHIVTIGLIRVRMHILKHAPEPWNSCFLEGLKERPLQTMKQELKTIQCPLDYPCVDYLVCGSSVHDRKLLTTNDIGGK